MKINLEITLAEAFALKRLLKSQMQLEKVEGPRLAVAVILAKLEDQMESQLKMG